MLCRQRRFREREKHQREASLKKRLYRQKKQSENSKILGQNSSSSHDVVVSQFEEDLAEYVTPDKYKSQIRQRTYDVSQKLPNSPGLKTAVISRCVKKLIRSPSTHLEMTRVMNRYCSVVAKFKDNKALQQIVLKIRKYKANKNIDRLTRCVNELKQMTSIRQAAKRLDIHYSSLHRMLTVCEQ